MNVYYLSEINNLSLFGKNKLIIIHEANDKILSQIKDNFTKTNNVVVVLSKVYLIKNQN